MKSLYESILSSTNDGRESIIQSIETWLKKYGIKLYTINDKLEVNLLGGADLNKKELKELPSYIQFGVVRGDFFCSYNKLTTLKGSPKVVKVDFDCSHNKLKTLKGSPEKVGGRFNCSHNRLISLEGSPSKINEYFDCSDNKLKSLEGAPEEAKYFNCEQNTVKFTEDDVKKVCKVKYKIHV